MILAGVKYLEIRAIENNNESMDVNFVGRNNFGNITYRGREEQPKEAPN